MKDRIENDLPDIPCGDNYYNDRTNFSFIKVKKILKLKKFRFIQSMFQKVKYLFRKVKFYDR